MSLIFVKHLTRNRFSVFGLLMIFSLNLHGQTVSTVDGLTEKWLSISSQTRKIEQSFSAEQPILEQRIELLKAELTQMNELLEQNTDTQGNVEEQREILFAQQNLLEEQQTSLTNALGSVAANVSQLKELAPPYLAKLFEQNPLDNNELAENNTQTLTDALTTLTRFMEFNGKITTAKALISLEDGQSLMAQQLYLGANYAWFVSADGSSAGMGYARNNKWVWRIDQSVSSSAIKKALEIASNKALPDYVELPMSILLKGISTPGSVNK